MKKICLFLLSLLLNVSLYAYDFEANGIYYLVTSPTNHEVSVTYYSDVNNNYSGSITVPPSVSYNGVSYSVTSVGTKAFQYSFGLTSVSLASTVTVVGNLAFYECIGLTDITLSTTLNTLGDMVFYDCRALTSITLPATLTSMGYSVFTGCYALNSIHVDASNSAYSSENGVLFTKNKTALICYPPGKAETTYTIPISVTLVSNYAFEDCTKLTSLIIPASVNSIGVLAFYDCSGLTSLLIPSSVTTIGVRAFTKCSSLTSIQVDAGNAYFSAENGVLFNKNKTILVSYPAGRSETSYEIPQGVTSMASYALEYSNNLTSVTIPSSITEVVDHAFTYCSGLTSVSLPSSLTSIGNNAFFYCPKLAFFTIPPAVTYVGLGAFAHCFALKSITIPASVTNLASYAFYNCTGLTSIYDYHTTPLVLNPGDYTFYGVNKQTCTLYVPNGTASLYRSTALWQDFINVYEIPNDFFIEDGICYKITSTNEVAVTHGIATLESYSGDITIPATVTHAGIIYAVTSIGEIAFSGCNNLKSVTIPSSVTIIRNDAFAYSIGMTTITIPSSVSFVGNTAFWACMGLKSIYVYHSTPLELYPSAEIFNGVDLTNCTLYVPYGSASLYQAAPVWQDFIHIVEISTTGTGTITKINPINIYPNPVSDAFSITGFEGNAILSIYTLSGQLLFTKEIVEGTTITAGRLTKGNYLVKVKTSSAVITRKLAKQ